MIGAPVNPFMNNEEESDRQEEDVGSDCENMISPRHQMSKQTLDRAKREREHERQSLFDKAGHKFLF